jgi:hypothetical protein
LLLFSASTEFDIDYYTPLSSTLSIQLLNSQGGLVKTILNENTESGWHSILLNTSDLPDGMYILNMQGANKIKNIKIVVQK